MTKEEKSDVGKVYDNLFGEGEFKKIDLKLRRNITILFYEARINASNEAFQIARNILNGESEENDLFNGDKCVNCFEPLCSEEVEKFNSVCYECQELE